MPDSEKTVMLLDELAPLDASSGVRWPQLCGVWPSPSSRCRRPDTAYTLGLVAHLLDSD
jgi:hypothetical protein